MIGIRDDTAPAPPSPSRAPQLAARAFAESGWLVGVMGLEHRPGQERMANAVAEAFRDDLPLLFEAGTGIGKSLAYLVPGIIHATDLGRQLVVSTHTISLQEQIEKKDLPLCRRLFGLVPELGRYSGFASTVLVGKSNYLCTSRLSHALSDRASLFDDAGYAELQRVADWAAATPTGLRHDLQPPPDPEVWDSVSADSSSCSRRNCNCERCFYQRARARVRSAQVIVVNHALLFSLISAGGARAEGAADAGGVLFPGDFVVLDEAQTVPEVAQESFGLALGSVGVERSLRHLYNPKTLRGIMAKRADAEFRQRVADALEASAQFFAFLSAGLLAERTVVRVREEGVAEPLPCEPLAALERCVAKAADRLEEGRERDELLEQRGRLRAIRASVDEWLGLSNQGHVYWAERSGRRQTIVTLRSAPIDVAPELGRCLFGAGVSVVCTSATLAVGGETAPFAARVGAASARAEIAGSPFDFERNMRVYVAADIPLPSLEESRTAIDALADYVGFCCERVRGGSLVLFTSYRDMQAVAAIVEPRLGALGRPFLVQGGGLSRTELAQRMREAGDAILFGTDSFWTGVDVPGDALSQVVIARLPFRPPTHPIAEAQSDLIRERGGDPFGELTLPEALMQFRQGVGRLIRTKSDRGVITVLDSRVLAKSYGRLFVQSLPKTEFVRLTRENRDEQFRPFT